MSSANRAVTVAVVVYILSVFYLRFLIPKRVNNDQTSDVCVVFIVIHAWRA